LRHQRRIEATEAGYIHRATPRRRLPGIYRSSRICLVTPLRDGMNLVAKEYVAAQDADDPGVLILSQFAGAAEEMDQALIVNPYNIEETADIIRAALEMSDEERRRRHAALIATLRRNDASTWCSAFLARLARTPVSGGLSAQETPEPIREALERLREATLEPPEKQRRMLHN
jgi:trehalose-6-phosphate synthase